MTVLLDHCVSIEYAVMLREWGYEAVTLQSQTHADADDLAVIEVAQALDAVLLTVDMDFSDIRAYPPAHFAGIIVMRYSAENIAIVSATLKTALADLYRDDLRQSLVVINEDRYKIRRS